MRAIPWVEKLPIPYIKAYSRSLDILLQFFQEMIEQHKGKPDHSILSQMLVGSESGGNGDQPILSKIELVSNIWIFFVAGHEATANALACALNCLRAYPDIQEKLHHEIIEKIGQEKCPTLEELNQLIYLDCFIQEVLRLHAPVAAFASRVANDDVPYKGYLIPKGTRVGLFHHIIHTNPRIWEDPLVFRPERWSAENKKGRIPFSYVPFSLGTRQCIGSTFSLIEQRLFLARLLQKYKVVMPVKSEPFPMEKLFILGSENPLPLRVVERSK